VSPLALQTALVDRAVRNGVGGERKREKDFILQIEVIRKYGRMNDENSEKYNEI
jgi:hypothetical protein